MSDYEYYTDALFVHFYHTLICFKLIIKKKQQKQYIHNYNYLHCESLLSLNIVTADLSEQFIPSIYSIYFHLCSIHTLFRDVM